MAEMADWREDRASSIMAGSCVKTEPAALTWLEVVSSGGSSMMSKSFGVVADWMAWDWAGEVFDDTTTTVAWKL
jgi:hypothetical protein